MFHCISKQSFGIPSKREKILVAPFSHAWQVRFLITRDRTFLMACSILSLLYEITRLSVVHISLFLDHLYQDSSSMHPSCF